jgi:hypothetical protein
MKSVERDKGIKGSRERAAAALFKAALVLAVLTRLVFILLPRTPLQTKTVDSIGDSREYVALAENLAHHQTFSRDSVPPYRPELFRTPAYPLLLAPAFIVHRSSFIVHHSSFIIHHSSLTVQRRPHPSSPPDPCR